MAARSCRSALSLLSFVVCLVLVLAPPSRRTALAHPIGAEFQVNTYTTFNQGFPGVAADGAGGFVVVWQSGDFSGHGPDGDRAGVQGQRYTSAGTAVGAEFQVNTYITSVQRGPGVAADGAGGFVVVWQSGGSSGTDTSNYSIQGQRYTSAGTAVGAEFQVNTYTTSSQYLPAVGPDGAGGFVVVWQSFGSSGTDTSNYSIQGQRYTSAGTAVGAEFQVNTYTTSTQRDPAVGADGAGGFVVVWATYGSSGTDTSYWSVQGQRYTSAGTAVGAEFGVNTYTTSDQWFPAVAADGAGGFVVVWQSYGSSGTDTSVGSVQGQRYTSAGTAVGAQFQVNTYTPGDQFAPAVGPDGAGGFVVAWSSFFSSSGTDTSPASVQGQRYTSAGTAVGAEFQVNTYTTSSQYHPAVAADGAGGFVVVWQSYGSSGTDTSVASVQGQRFASATMPVPALSSASRVLLAALLMLLPLWRRRRLGLPTSGRG